MPLWYGGQGAAASLAGLPGNNTISLPPGGSYVLPSGWWMVKGGPNLVLQELDPVAGAWLLVGSGALNANGERIRSDGNSMRVANPTGCAVGANLTAAGSGYTSSPVVTPSAGGSIWRALVGGAVGTSVTVTNGGIGYTYPPIVVFSAPPAGGIQATGHAVLTGGQVSSVVVDNQGAGYASPPTISFINDSREGQNNIGIGTSAAAVAVLTGAGQVTGVLCLDHGSAVAAVPTLAFSGGGGSGAAATALMDWTITSFNVSGGASGAAYGAPCTLSAYASPAAGSAFLNPMTQQNLVRKRPAQVGANLSGGVIQQGGQIMVDGGCYDAVPSSYVASSGSIATTVASFTAPTMGGVTDSFRIYPG